jgi:hypothetical protein
MCGGVWVLYYGDTVSSHSLIGTRLSSQIQNETLLNVVLTLVMVDDVNVNQISQCFAWLSAAVYCFEPSDYWEADLVVGRMTGISGNSYLKSESHSSCG